MASKATAITNVRVFDGFQLSEMTTVVMENGLISDRKDADVVIDGKGGFLMPGLIDSHSHLTWKANAKACVRTGATGLAAKAYGETSVGTLEPGRRADLILIDGDPTADIAQTANIRKVWIGGNEVFSK